MVEIKIGDWVKTPRFCKVKISAILANNTQAREFGYTEGTDFQDENWSIKGRIIGENRMEFAAIRQDGK